MKFPNFFGGAPKVQTVEKDENPYSVEKLKGYLKQWNLVAPREMVMDNNFSDARDYEILAKIQEDIFKQVEKLTPEEKDKAFEEVDLTEFQKRVLSQVIFDMRKAANKS
jgi:hypothetical protein